MARYPLINQDKIFKIKKKVRRNFSIMVRAVHVPYFHPLKSAWHFNRQSNFVNPSARPSSALLHYLNSVNYFPRPLHFVVDAVLKLLAFALADPFTTFSPAATAKVVHRHLWKLLKKCPPRLWKQSLGSIRSRWSREPVFRRLPNPN